MCQALLKPLGIQQGAKQTTSPAQIELTCYRGKGHKQTNENMERVQW